MLVVLEVLGYLVLAITRGLRWRDYKPSLVTDPEVMAPVRVLIVLRETPALCL
jgi:hypothetical protein